MNYSLFPRFKRVLITGGSGFIGSNFILRLLKTKSLKLFNIDKISNVSDIDFLNDLNDKQKSNYRFLRLDLKNQLDIEKVVEKLKPELIVNFAAESHVDKSIKDPKEFLESNTIGTFNLLEASRSYWEKLKTNQKENFRFLHISTDEVFGSLNEKGKFTEKSPYDPSSPYSASKAASDHFVSAWYKTYNFPSIITNCSNNYGPRQYPEKLIPLTIHKILKNEKIPIFGDGKNVRNWLFVEDHIDAIILIALKGSLGKKYCIGGMKDITNLSLVKEICKKVDAKTEREQKSEELIYFVKDRLGHDFRYSISTEMLKKELGWNAKTNLEVGLEKTIDWYLRNKNWLKNI